MITVYFEIESLATVLFILSALVAILVAVYTAFLFAQAKGRDFWQSPVMVLHMLTHSIMAGSAALIPAGQFMPSSDEWAEFNKILLFGSTVLNLLLMLVELTITHPTKDARTVVHMIVRGRYMTHFWIGAIAIGNIVPLAFLSGLPFDSWVAPMLSLIGIYLTERIWVEAPQRIPLT
jgi:formate-dependent nitrite reductase membrane component NrfD